MIPDRLHKHLESWLGAWPPRGDLTVIGSELRTRPGWDDQVRPLVGVATPDGVVLSVPPDVVDDVRGLGDSIEQIGPELPSVLGRPDQHIGMGVFRWSVEPLDDGDPGLWLPTTDERLPDWLRPFNGDVLVGFEDGRVAAGVGRKQHDRWGHELAVVTEEDFRGRGWARRLIGQAARCVLARGAIPTYLHDPTNVASARTADAAGFPDRGWRIIG
ncbi:MAG: GNAT family N-acetyltransferase, partial [Acidimicrobiia bacterium]|nr:GNAT family N-acetyltransferase [Acidimicrobiia bacterium]